MLFFKDKKKNQETELSEFLKNTVKYLHDLSIKKGFAKKGFIYNNGLSEIGEVWVKESMSAPFKFEMNEREFLYSIATANMQMGMIFGRRCGLGAKNEDDLYSGFTALEGNLQELNELLNEDLGVTFEQWDDFRHFIIPKFSEIMKPYVNTQNKEDYIFRILLSYYLLGVSIGIEKYEPDDK